MEGQCCTVQIHFFGYIPVQRSTHQAIYLSACLSVGVSEVQHSALRCSSVAGGASGKKTAGQVAFASEYRRWQ